MKTAEYRIRELGTQPLNSSFIGDGEKVTIGGAFIIPIDKSLSCVIHTPIHLHLYIEYRQMHIHTRTNKQEKKFDFETVTLTELMTLYGMDDDIAVKIKELIDTKEVAAPEALREVDFITPQQYEQWSQSFK